jgi:hypothetical protein
MVPEPRGLREAYDASASIRKPTSNSSMHSESTSSIPPTGLTLVDLYLQLADASARQGQTLTQSRFLALAIRAAHQAGAADLAERCRQGLATIKPDHALASEAALPELLGRPSVRAALDELTRMYPVTKAEYLLGTFWAAGYDGHHEYESFTEAHRAQPGRRRRPGRLRRKRPRPALATASPTPDTDDAPTPFEWPVGTAPRRGFGPLGLALAAGIAIGILLGMLLASSWRPVVAPWLGGSP